MSYKVARFHRPFVRYLYISNRLILRNPRKKKNGDPIRIDARSEARTIDLLISDAEWEERRKAWSPPPLRASSGTLFKYIQCVSTASEGCVTDEVKTGSGIAVAAPKTPAVAELEAKIAELEGLVK